MPMSKPLKSKVLFICLGNSCRSIMAEALARHFYGEVITTASAGLNPLGFVAAETLAVLAEIGVEIAGLHSKGLAEVDLEGCRLLVNLSHFALPTALPPHLRRRLLQRPVVDPVGRNLSVYRQARDEIRRLLDGDIVPLLLSF